MIRKLNRTSGTYLFTIAMDDPQDLKALADLRESINNRRKWVKQLNARRANQGMPIEVAPRVKTYFRRPTIGKYSWGGSVTKSQMPKEADVYLA
jgi:hypothetical protein